MEMSNIEKECLLFGKMRYATAEEQKSVSENVKSISIEISESEDK